MIILTNLFNEILYGNDYAMHCILWRHFIMVSQLISFVFVILICCISCFSKYFKITHIPKPSRCEYWLNLSKDINITLTLIVYQKFSRNSQTTKNKLQMKKEIIKQWRISLEGKCVVNFLFNLFTIPLQNQRIK